jgi:lipopolysaccharide export system protein LptA
MCYENSAMEKIDPQHDHLKLEQYCPGQQVIFRGNAYTIQRRTTLASGEAAVVLQGDKEQFVVGANQFFAGIK